MRTLWGALALLLLVGGADARQHYPARGHRIVLAAQAPLDSFTQPSGAYGFRKLRSAYAGPAIRIRRASDNAELDINFLGCTGFTGCPWDGAAAVAHCAATTCFARTWYDQSGLAKDQAQTTAANQPLLVFNCTGSLPCLRTTVSTQVLQTAAGGYVPVPPTSYSAVANRSSGTGICYWPYQYNVNSFASRNTFANQWMLFGSGNIVAAATDNVWHSGIGVMNGASSAVRIDGVETAGTVTALTTAGALIGVWSAATVTCNWAEVIQWDSYAMPAAARATLGANQKSFWGTP